MSESSRAAEASAVAAVPAEPCDKLQVSLQQLLRVITDILDSLEQGDADEALSQKLAKYVAVLAEVDQRAASLPPFEVPVAVLQHMDQDGGSPSVWCQSLLDRLKNGMEGFKQRKAPVASLSRHLRAQGWGLASLNSLSRQPSEAEGQAGQVTGNDMSERTTKKRPLDSTAHSSLGSRERKAIMLTMEGDFRHQFALFGVVDMGHLVRALPRSLTFQMPLLRRGPCLLLNRGSHVQIYAVETSPSALEEWMELDPYQCIAKVNRKYASECTEVHLANKGAESISKKFEHFSSLEVVWFQGNRLSRVENLETNFRIREVYIQNNRLVSLAGLKTFKFLRVLLASGNQLRNLDKQLALLSRFPFLKKLELFDNPVAEEPDYRLRLIYHVPQVELLDQHTVKLPERLRADEVVPNLDKVSAAKVEKPRPKGHQFSVLERQCIHEARSIQERRRLEEELSMSKSFHVVDKGAPPDCKVFKANRDRWMDPRKKVLHETLRPTPWECHEMRGFILARAKKELTRADVEALAKELAETGIEEVGRFLKSPEAVFEELVEQDAVEAGMTALARSLKFHTESKGKVKGTPHPLDKLMQDASATMPPAEVITWLLKLDWPRFDDELLDRTARDNA
eukprot:s1897_g10.t1